MAAANAAQTLQKEATCPICLEYFSDPVVLGCDHNFCRACITHRWAGYGLAVSCPQCKQVFVGRKLKPNRLLRNVVEAARGLRRQSEGEAAEREGLCENHREPLKLFCKDDEVPICLVCDKSRQHRDHTVIPAEEAAEEYKEKIQGHLKTLKEEREKLSEIKLNRKKRGDENFRNAKIELHKIVHVFEKLGKFLMIHQKFLRAQQRTLEDDFLTMNTRHRFSFSGEISRLSDLISELEGKCQKPASEFLQDVRSMLSRCEKRKFQEPEEISPELEKELKDLPQRTLAALKAIKTFKRSSKIDTDDSWTSSRLGQDTLRSALEGKRPVFLRSQDEFAATVTLDPDTAHPEVELSEDGKSASCSYLCNGVADTRPEVLENPRKFDTSPCVLGREGFTSGTHSWEVEVEVEDVKDWAVGVARASVKRKGQISPSPEEGIWAVRLSGDNFETFSSPGTRLYNMFIPRRIRVYLDCDRGQVTFFDVDDETLIFTFPLGTHAGEKFRPWFWVGIHCQLRVYP